MVEHKDWALSALDREAVLAGEARGKAESLADTHGVVI
jgi:hypothetical protein